MINEERPPTSYQAYRLREKSLNDYQVKNIEKSVNQSRVNIYSHLSIVEKKKQPPISEKEKAKMNEIKELYKNRITNKKLTSKAPDENFYEKKNTRSFTSMSTAQLNENQEIIKSLYDTSPPIGNKRPTTSMLKPIIKKPKNTGLNIEADKMKKEIYYEAISQDQTAGHIFMKYLQSTNKTVN